jgi:hypothetical protein
MSIFQGIRDLCIAVAIIAAVILSFEYFPFVLGAVVLFAISASIIIVAIVSWRRGRMGINAGGRFLVYYRQKNPFIFWFYLILEFLVGGLGCGFVLREIFRKLGVF